MHSSIILKTWVGLPIFLLLSAITNARSPSAFKNRELDTAYSQITFSPKHKVTLFIERLSDPLQGDGGVVALTNHWRLDPPSDVVCQAQIETFYLNDKFIRSGALSLHGTQFSAEMRFFATNGPFHLNPQCSGSLLFKSFLGTLRCQRTGQSVSYLIELQKESLFGYVSFALCFGSNHKPKLVMSYKKAPNRIKSTHVRPSRSQQRLNALTAYLSSVNHLASDAHTAPAAASQETPHQERGATANTLSLLRNSAAEGTLTLHQVTAGMHVLTAGIAAHPTLGVQAQNEELRQFFPTLKPQFDFGDTDQNARLKISPPDPKTGISWNISESTDWQILLKHRPERTGINLAFDASPAVIGNSPLKAIVYGDLSPFPMIIFGRRSIIGPQVPLIFFNSHAIYCLNLDLFNVDVLGLFALRPDVLIESSQPSDRPFKPLLWEVEKESQIELMGPVTSPHPIKHLGGLLLKISESPQR